MSELKISKAAEKAAEEYLRMKPLILDKDQCVIAVAIALVTAEEKFHQWHLSELDRIAGPLVEALEHIHARSSPASSAPPFDVISFRGHIATLLHHYRKERGE